MVEGGLAFFTQGKGANAIDKTKPWGVIVQTDGDAVPARCLPAGDEARRFVDSRHGVRRSGQGRRRRREGAGAADRAIGLREAQRWLGVHQHLGRRRWPQLPENPQDPFADLVTEYDVAARVSVKDVPDMYRQFAVQAMQAGMQQQMKQKEATKATSNTRCVKNWPKRRWSRWCG